MNYSAAPEEKSNLHRAYDAAILLLGKLGDDSSAPRSSNVAAKARTLATRNFASMTDSTEDEDDEDDETVDMMDSNEPENQKKPPAQKKEFSQFQFS
jgi:hypothetical protein